MREFLKNNRIVLLPYLLLLASSLALHAFYSKVSIHLFVNQFVGNPFTNTFYYYITYLGDGRVAGILLLIILIYNVRVGLYIAASFLTASLLANIIKYFYFGDTHRPFYVFQYLEKLSPVIYVKDVELNIHNSFPSGHATQSFAIFMGLVFITANSRLKLLFFALALLTAFSRIYLSQHWLIDIAAGSIIGSVAGFVYYYAIIQNDRLRNLNKPLFSLFGFD